MIQTPDNKKLIQDTLYEVKKKEIPKLATTTFCFLHIRQKVGCNHSYLLIFSGHVHLQSFSGYR